MYAIALLALMTAAWCAWRACRRILRPGTAGLVTVITVCFLLYVSALVPGVLRKLHFHWIGATLIVLSVALAALFLILARRTPGSDAERAGHAKGGDKTTEPLPDPGLNRCILVAAVVGLLGLAPILSFVSDLPWRFVEAGLVFEWDTVSYHLPALIEFLQAGSLWYLGGAYSSYSYGYELLAALPVAAFHASWPLVPVHILALTLLLVSMYVVSRSLCESASTWLRRPIPTIAVFLMAAGGFSRAFAFEMGRVGKNDLFQAACILAALGCLLEARRLIGVATRNPGRRLLLASSAAVLGLALATKPTTLAFVPAFAVLYVLVERERIGSGDSHRAAGVWAAAGTWLGAVALIGGFFLFRNLWSMHRLIAPDLAGGSFGQSLWAVLPREEYWTLHSSSILLLIGVLSFLVGVVCTLRARKFGHSPFVPLAIFLVAVSGLAALLFTPFVAQSPTNWYIRLGMAGLAPAAVWAAFGVAWAFRQLARLSAAPSLLLLAAIAIGLLLIPRKMEAYRSVGLPGYETVAAGLPASNVYSVIQSTDKPVRIYAAGLRPLGLYGPRYENRVFYDLHSDVLSPEAKGIARLMAVMKSFEPQLIAIAVDPHGTEKTPHKPLVEWLRKQPCFQEVFSDDSTSVFLVREGWQKLLEQHPPAPGPVHMTG